MKHTHSLMNRLVNGWAVIGLALLGGAFSAHAAVIPSGPLNTVVPFTHLNQFTLDIDNDGTTDLTVEFDVAGNYWRALAIAFNVAVDGFGTFGDEVRPFTTGQVVDTTATFRDQGWLFVQSNEPVGLTPAEVEGLWDLAQPRFVGLYTSAGHPAWVQLSFVDTGTDGLVDQMILIDFAYDNSANSITTGSNLSSPASTYVQSGDFNGDGRSDILLRDDTGQLRIYFMSGASVLGQVPTGAPLGANVRVDGIGDFNKDGRSDILLRDTVTQSMTVRIMNGASVLAQVNLAPMPPGDTRGAADFNGDGRADIVFQNPTTGQVTIWFMSGASILAQVNVGTSLDPIQGLGDVNGDGRTDILMRSGDQLRLWIMNGASILSQPNVGVPLASGTQVVAMGDLNGDSRADILLRNGDDLIVRILSGASVLSQITLGSSAAGLDTYGLGLNRLTGNGALRMWVMSGASILAQVSLSAVPPTTTEVIAPR